MKPLPLQPLLHLLIVDRMAKRTSTVAAELLKRKLAPNAERAAAYVMAGLVRRNGERIEKPGDRCRESDELTVHLPGDDVGRGAKKLEGAFQAFGWDVQGAICADVGSSTGGFTQVLLRHGAAKVYAIDVGYGELAWELRSDPRVMVMERTNAKNVDKLPERVSRISMDVSFISIRQLLPQLRTWGDETLQICTLVKPQFEVAAAAVPDGGVITDSSVHRAVLEEILEWCEKNQFICRAGCASPLKGRDGNQEFFLLLSLRGNGASRMEILTQCFPDNAP